MDETRRWHVVTVVERAGPDDGDPVISESTYHDLEVAVAALVKVLRHARSVQRRRLA